MALNLKRILTGIRARVQRPKTKRIRINDAPVGVADRPAPTLITVGPAKAFGREEVCWLVQFEGPGYVDYDRCYSRESINSCLSLFKKAYPTCPVKWLVKGEL